MFCCCCGEVSDTAIKQQQTGTPTQILGRRWLELTDGHGSEALLPFLLEAAPLTGAEAAPVAAAIEAAARDKNQALDALDKVRVAPCIGSISLYHPCVRACCQSCMLMMQAAER